LSISGGRPAPEFWANFPEMHLKLVQAARTDKPPRSASPGVSAALSSGSAGLAVLLLYVALQLTGPGVPFRTRPDNPATGCQMVPLPEGAGAGSRGRYARPCR